MSTVTLNAETMPVKNPTTIQVDRRGRNYTADELAFARAEGLDNLPTRYVLEEKPRRETFTTDEGYIFRDAGTLYVRKCADGQRRFVAYLQDGAVHHDFRYLDRVINDAAHGRMQGWDRYTFKNGDEGWIFDYTSYQIDHLNEFIPAAVIIDETSDSPGLVGYGTSWGIPCTEPRCRNKFHESEDVNHVLEVLEDTINERGSYEIEICKDLTKPDSRWYLNVWVNGDTTELNHEQVAKLANDLTWMALECQTTNAKEGRK